jgi:[ribosomal protein S5]-alanine N-acetyltransferase
MTQYGLAPLVATRLRLRPPHDDDASRIFRRYSSVAEVVRYVGWPRHTSMADTQQFLQSSRSEWQQWPVGTLLIEDRGNGELIGFSGLSFETPYRASTGYVLARDKWGMGYASEALGAVVQFARQLRVARLYALCHATHGPSRRVLERNLFALEGILRKYVVFPNLGAAEPQDVCCYSLAEPG